MKSLFISFIMLMFLASCTQNTQEATTTTTTTNDEMATEAKGQAAVEDNESAKDVVKVAAGSADHTTLVAAIKQAELVDALSNAGPFTVFAPTNAAFDKLPKGTVEGLLKPDQKDALSNILEYHVYVGVIKTENMRDGQVL